MKGTQNERRSSLKAKWSESDNSTENQNTNSAQSEDVVDGLPEVLKFNTKDLIFLLISVGTYLFDVGSDIFVAYSLYNNGHDVYFALTLTFIIFPAVIMGGFSLKWYLKDKKSAEYEGIQNVVTPRWILQIVGVFLLMSPVVRYSMSIYYGLKFRRTKKNKLFYHLMVNEDADAALLRLFECFIEAGPQLLLQIYILAVETAYHDDRWLIVTVQVFSILGSLISMAWSLVSYHRTLRISLESKLNITILGSLTQMLWHLFTISSRVIALALFASLYPTWFVIFCFSHWGIMTLWIISMKTEFCESKGGEIIYNAVLGIVYIFCYFNAVDSPTRYRYTIFYVVSFVENSIFIVVWYFMCKSTLWYRHAALVTQFSAFFVGLTFMILYYLLLHPVGTISMKLCSTSDQCQSDIVDNGGTRNHLNKKRLGRFDIVLSPPIQEPKLVQYEPVHSPAHNPPTSNGNGKANITTPIETAV